MKYFVVLAVVAAVAAAVPVEVAEDEQGQQYYLVPLVRERRQTKWGISDLGVNLGHKGTIFANTNHQLDGTAYAAKSFKSHGLQPDLVGGRVDYSYKPSASGVFLQADHTRHMGTDVSAGAKYNFVHRKDFDLGAVASYDRHFGGPSGAGKPQGYVGLEAKATF